jgi:AcrB/AcrD/AcrF family
VAVLGQEQMVRAGKDDALIAISFAPYRRSPSISPRGRDGPERRSSSSPTARSPRFRRRHTRRSRSGGQMTPRETDPPGPTRKEPTGRAGAVSRFFIERPVLSNVIAFVVVLIGLVALLNLPSAQYLNVVPPTVQVTTRYPGASARTVVD